MRRETALILLLGTFLGFYLKAGNRFSTGKQKPIVVYYKGVDNSIHRRLAESPKYMRIDTTQITVQGAEELILEEGGINFVTPNANGYICLRIEGRRLKNQYMDGDSRSVWEVEDAMIEVKKGKPIIVLDIVHDDQAKNCGGLFKPKIRILQYKNKKEAGLD